MFQKFGHQRTLYSTLVSSTMYWTLRLLCFCTVMNYTLLFRALLYCAVLRCPNLWTQLWFVTTIISRSRQFNCRNSVFGMGDSVIDLVTTFLVDTGTPDPSGNSPCFDFKALLEISRENGFIIEEADIFLGLSSWIRVRKKWVKIRFHHIWWGSGTTTKGKIPLLHSKWCIKTKTSLWLSDLCLCETLLRTLTQFDIHV